MVVCVARKRIVLYSRRSIGKGGEADVYDIGRGQALKVFKAPDHPDYAGLPHEQQAARERLAEHQKKLPAFPSHMPDRVVKPEDLATDRTGRHIVGYTMRLLKGAEPLRRYAERGFRQAVPQETVMGILRDLHHTVSAVHRAGAVIGDFNDLNVLVLDSEAYLIDADSFQFGPFLCRMFTTQFVDPLLCDRHASSPLLLQPYTAESDWYAFAVMLMQCFLFVGPYGGVYRPRDPVKRIAHDARPLHRITVFHSEVGYPKPAVHYRVLPDELLQYFHQVFERDRRGEFPRQLIEALRWTKCTACGTEHARPLCPECAQTSPATVKAVTTIRGKVTATRIFRTRGVILFAAGQGGKLRWLSHEHGLFKREDNSEVLRGRLDPQMRFRLQGRATLIGKGGVLFTLTPGQPPVQTAVDSYGNLPIFDASERLRYWAHGGQLWRDGQLGQEYIGDVLSGQTLFWVGSTFGFGFYRAGNLCVSFVFDAQQRGINDSVKMPPLRGQLVDSTCAFSSDRCWFFIATQERGKTLHQCVVIRRDGTVEATAQAERGDSSWLGTLRGKCAVRNHLFAPTDEGVVRVEVNNGHIAVAAEFPDTEPFVDAGCYLFPGPQGLYVVNQRDIYLLTMA